jgi:SAM-dependent methyltransferase
MTRCPACAEPWVPRPRPLRAGVWTVPRCRSCGTGVTTPLPDPEVLARGYADPHYFESRGIHHDDVLPDHRARARGIRDRAPGRRLLEVGCGEGYLLAALRDEGFEVKGCDVSSTAAAAARTRFNLDIFHGGVEAADFEPAGFDVVVMLHVLEHVANPEALLRLVNRLLRDEGLLVVEVPNINAGHVLRPGLRRHILHLPFHLVHFTPGGLAQVLSRSGFQIRDLIIPFGPPAAPLLTGYERVRDLVRPQRRRRSAPSPELRHSISATVRPRPPGVKERILAWLRRISPAYKMTAWVEKRATGSLP